MKRWIPHREQLLRSRWIAPIAHWLEDDRLWHFERGSVARGVAIGLFFGFVLPVAQFLFAVGFAVWLRGHVAVAAASTLVSNPITFPPIYWAAYRIGRALLGEPGDREGAEIVEQRTQEAIADEGWFAGVVDTVLAAGAPLIVGLSVMGTAAAAIGFALVWLLWRHPK